MAPKDETGTVDRISEFLNPKSMITPGVAGSITMLLTNTLWVQFALPQKWTALVVSFLLGALVFINVAVPLWQRIIYYLLNSLIIFSVGIGTNSVGSKIETAKIGSSGFIEVGQFITPQTAYAQTKRGNEAEKASSKKESGEDLGNRINNPQSTSTNSSFVGSADKVPAGPADSQKVEGDDKKNTEKRLFFDKW